MALLSIHLNSKQKMMQTYQFAITYNKERNSITQENHTFPLASFQIKLQQVFDQLTDKVNVSSFKVQQLDLPASILPISKINFFNTIIKQLYNNDNELSQSQHNSVALMSFKNNEVSLSVDNVLFQNTPYILQLNLLLKKLSNQSYQVFNNKISYDYEFIAIVDTMQALFSKQQQKQAIKYLQSQQLLPSVLHHYLLTGDKKETLLEVAKNIMQKFFNIKKNSIDDLVLKYKQIAQEMASHQMNLISTYYTYILSTQENTNNVTIERKIQSLDNVVVIQQFINRLMNHENKLIIIPFSDAEKYYISYKLKDVDKAIQLPLRFGYELTTYSFYQLLCIQPIVLSSYQLNDIQIQLINEQQQPQRMSNIIVTDLTQHIISGIFTDQDKFYYYNSIFQLIKADEPIVKQQIDQNLVQKIKDMRNLVIVQQNKIMQNDISIKQQNQIVKNQKQLSSVELQYLKDNVRLSQNGHFQTISDVAADLVTSFKKYQLSKMLIQSLQFLNKDSIKTQQLINKLKDEEEKLLQDQRRLIAQYQKVLKQFERKKMGLSLVHPDPIDSLNEQTSYIAFNYVDPQTEKKLLPPQSFPDNVSNVQKQASIIDNNSRPQNLTQLQEKVNQQMKEPEIEMIEITQPTSMSFSQVESKPTVRQSSVSQSDVHRMTKSEVNQYRKPPQILANVSQASKFLEMNMK